MAVLMNHILIFSFYISYFFSYIFKMCQKYTEKNILSIAGFLLEYLNFCFFKNF